MSVVDHPRRWRVSPAWLLRAREVARRDRDLARGGTRYTLGGAALAALRRPWRFLAVAAAVRAASGRPDPSYAPVHPEDSRASMLDGVGADRLRADIRTLCDDTRALIESSAWRLGDRLLRLRHRRFGYALLPLVVAHHVLRAERPLVRPPARPATTTGSSRRMQPAAAPARAARWSCLAPPWLGEMLALDDVPALAPGESPPDGVVVALGAQPAATVRAFAEWRRGSEDATSCRAAVWLLDDRDDDREWTRLLRPDDLVYASDPARAATLTRALGRPVAHLPLAVQPLLHNPIAWWHGDHGIAGRHEACDDVPDQLRLLVDAARGRDLDDASATALAAHLGTPLPAPSVPRWADAATARDVVRHARMRHVLAHATLADRLARLTRDAGLPPPPRAPLVSVAVCTIRPARLREVVRTFASQTHARKELVLVLHGDGFAAIDVDAIVAAADAPVRVLRAPARWSLGECRQLACDESAGDLVCFMDDDNHYGPRYVESHVLAMTYSEAGLTGKVAHVIRFTAAAGGADRMVLFNVGNDHRYLKVAGGGRLVLRREILDHVRWRPMAVVEDVAFIDDCESLGVPMLSTDRFQFVRVRADPREHTSATVVTRFSTPEQRRSLPRDARPEDLFV